jgi:hypothetical protein
LRYYPPNRSRPPAEDAFYRDFDAGLSDLSDSLAAEVEQLGGVRGSRSVAAAKVAASERRSTARTEADDVGTLFEALRTTAEVEVVVERVAPDPIGFHERVVIPALNMGVRDLKRRIVDLQAGALEALRTKGWSPEARTILGQITPALDQAVQRASSGGLEAARALAMRSPFAGATKRRLMACPELTSNRTAAMASRAPPG